MKGGAAVSVRMLALITVFLPACNIFEPREAEDPTQSGLNYRPATTPEIVIQNLQSAIDQKSLANYTLCFSDPLKGNRPLVFIASTEASAQYPSIMATWTHAQEESYFRNLIARSSPTAYSALRLELDNSVVGSDSVTYTFRYTLVFEHNEAGFPATARGTLQFTLGTDQANIWSIYRWADYKTGDDISWSMFKGKFSN